jgi:hypothetical protein
VELHASAGQYLIYEVTIQGAQPLFAIGDQFGNIILSPYGPPKGVYRQRWPTTPPPAPSVTHTLNVAFLAAPRAHYRVGLFDAQDSPIVTLKDCAYEATTPSDWWLESLRILVS